MAPERLILCGGAGPAGARPANAIELHAYGREPNVHFKLEQLRRRLWVDPSPVLRDLLDVAIYAYVADQAVPRANGGRLEDSEIGAGWRRNLRVRVPVREPDRWNTEAVRRALESTLGFVSEDDWAFEFPRLTRDTPLAPMLDFATDAFAGDVGEVVLFSGGLDSLAGAVHEAVNENKRVLLVNHRSTEKLTRTHEELVRELAGRTGPRAPLHTPVWVNKVKTLGREATQRTRSFLFAALGAVFAHTVGLSRVRFYENGVTSLNLPPVGQVLGARASRTTHPRTLAGYTTFLSALFGRRFTVENRFQADTKTDVVRRIVDAGCGPLIARSRSCAHTWQAKTRTHSHCGVCSQCIDRRFAVLAAGAAEYDPAAGYAVDLLTGTRPKGEPAMMMSAYLSQAERLGRMGRDEFAAAFPELSRALPDLGPPAVALAQTHDLHVRHAQQVQGVLVQALQDNAQRVLRRELPPGCALCMQYGDGGAPAPESEPVRPGGNYFLHCGDGWRARFGDGDEQFYKPDRGLSLLHVLLSHPNREFTPSELEVWVLGAGGPRPNAAVGQAVAAGQLGTGAAVEDEMMDADAVEASRARVAEIEEGIALLRDSTEPGTQEMIETLQQQKELIEAQLRQAVGLHGRRRAIGTDSRERVRKRVGMALARGRKRIAKRDTAFGAHLKATVLTTGRSVRYSPRDAVIWTTEG